MSEHDWIVLQVIHRDKFAAMEREARNMRLLRGDDSTDVKRAAGFKRRLLIALIVAIPLVFLIVWAVVL